MILTHDRPLLLQLMKRLPFWVQCFAMTTDMEPAISDLDSFVLHRNRGKI